MAFGILLIALPVAIVGSEFQNASEWRAAGQGQHGRAGGIRGGRERYAAMEWERKVGQAEPRMRWRRPTLGCLRPLGSKSANTSASCEVGLGSVTQEMHHALAVRCDDSCLVVVGRVGGPS